MEHTFGVLLPFDFDAETFDVFDIEPDIDGIDWVEMDPQIGVSATLFVRGRSTRGVHLRLDVDTLNVVVPGLASDADWDAALTTLANVCALFENVMVGWNNDALDLHDLQEACDAATRSDNLERDSAALLDVVRKQSTVMIPGPLRPVHIGPEMAAQVESSRCSVEAILLRTNYLTGPTHVAEAVEEVIGERPMLLTVLGPELRTLLPKCDVVLIESGRADEPPTLVDVRSIDEIPGLTVTRLDEFLRLVDAVPESPWREVLAAARRVALI